jgi:glycosyltransferase involved in cell wall biosynthesis
MLSPIADGIVAVSQGVAGDLSQATGIPESRITVINNPAITADFDERVAVDVEHPWLDDPTIPVFVTAGRLVPQKDHETLLRALAIYRKTSPARLLVLGTGPLEEPLRAFAGELGIADAVDFLGFCNNPLPYMRRASAFILSSRYEGFGNVIVEALGCGTPVVSTDCPYGPSEILAGGRWGRLTPVGNAEAMAAALSGDLRKQFPPEKLRERARQFTAGTAVKQYMELFDAL